MLVTAVVHLRGMKKICQKNFSLSLFRLSLSLFSLLNITTLGTKKSSLWRVVETWCVCMCPSPGIQRVPPSSSTPLWLLAPKYMYVYTELHRLGHKISFSAAEWRVSHPRRAHTEPAQKRSAISTFTLPRICTCPCACVYVFCSHKEGRCYYIWRKWRDGGLSREAC